jgi:hypothetical protein
MACTQSLLPTVRCAVLCCAVRVVQFSKATNSHTAVFSEANLTSNTVLSERVWNEWKFDSQLTSGGGTSSSGQGIARGKLSVALCPLDNVTDSIGFDRRGAGVWLQFDALVPTAFISSSVYGGENTAWLVQYSDDGHKWTDVTKPLRLGEFQWNKHSWKYAGAHRFWRYFNVENNDVPSFFGWRWYTL